MAKTNDRLLEFYYDMYNRNIPVPDKYMEQLISEGYIDPPEEPEQLPAEKQKVEYHRDYSKVHPDEIPIDEKTVVTGEAWDEEIISEDKFKDKVKQAIFAGNEEVKTSEWKIPEERRLNPEKDFVKWINAINKDFRQIRDHKVTYKRFNKYRQQAYKWLEDKTYIEDFDNIHDKITWLKDTERPRIKENSLYFLNKYLVLKEGTIEGGGRSYTAWLVHEIICFLFDNHLSFMVGKARQIGATSTLGGLFLKRVVFYKNYFAKFITQDEKKGIEIFGDKIKFPLGQLGAIKPGVLNDRDNLLWLGYKPEKGAIKGVNSKLEVVAPNVYAINGGSPDLVGIDEIGNIGILTEMLNEGRPAMFHVDPDTGKIKFVRQVVCWGTGGETDKGGKAFEREFTALTKQWNEGNYAMGMIPIFFDCFSKKGMSEEFYEKEKKFYYSRTGPDAERSRVQFHQHYPRTIEDMFLTSAKTLIPIDEINRHISRIQNKPHTHRQQYGFFQPIYDYTQPMPEGSHYEYKVVDAEWIPCDPTDPRCSAIITQHPEKDWLNRYFKGTDPIMTDSGLSNMSSAIYDKYLKTIVACIRFRPNYHKEAYAQSMLLGLYYGKPKELVEGNIGTGYINFVEPHGLYNTIVPNKMLPKHLQGGANLDGIDKRRGRSSRILNNLRDFIYSYADNIDIEEWWIELKTFVSKPTTSGEEKYEPINKTHYRDDFLDAGTYGYMLGEIVYAGREPIDPNENNTPMARKMKYRYEYNSQGKLTLKKGLA